MKTNLFSWLSIMFKEFLSETYNRSLYEVVELNECSESGAKIAIIKLSQRHVIEKKVSDIVLDMELLEGFDKKTIRTLTYIATLESQKPDYMVISQRLGDKVDDYIFELKSRKNKETFIKNLDEIIQDKTLLSGLSPSDATKLGYLSGVKETTQEFQMLLGK